MKEHKCSKCNLEASHYWDGEQGIVFVCPLHVDSSLQVNFNTIYKKLTPEEEQQLKLHGSIFQRAYEDQKFKVLGSLAAESSKLLDLLKQKHKISAEALGKLKTCKLKYDKKIYKLQSKGRYQLQRNIPKEVFEWLNSKYCGKLSDQLQVTDIAKVVKMQLKQDQNLLVFDMEKYDLPMCKAHVKIVRILGMEMDLSSKLHSLGKKCLDEKKFEDANQAFQEALTLQTKLHLETDSGLTLYELARTLCFQCFETNTGKEFRIDPIRDIMPKFQEALEIFQKYNLRQKMCLCYFEMGKLLEKAKIYDSVLPYYTEAINMATSDHYTKYLVQKKIIDFFLQFKKFEEATLWAEAALETAQTQLSLMTEQEAFHCLGKVYFKQQKFEKFEECYRKGYECTAGNKSSKNSIKSLKMVRDEYANAGYADEARRIEQEIKNVQQGNDTCAVF